MKQELEKLGFEYQITYHQYCLKIKNFRIAVDINTRNVYYEDSNTFNLIMSYNHEKLKQLIEILK